MQLTADKIKVGIARKMKLPWNCFIVTVYYLVRCFLWIDDLFWLLQSTEIGDAVAALSKHKLHKIRTLVREIIK